MHQSRDLPTAADVMTILGALYEVGQPRDSWLTGVLRSISSTLDRGAGVVGLLYDISGERRLHTDLMEGINIPAGWREVGYEMHRDARLLPRIIDSYRSRLCGTLTELVQDPRALGQIRREYDRHGMGEQIMINGVDGSGKGCVLYLSSRGDLTLSDAERDLFSRLATHLATAYRLQRRLAGGGKVTSIGTRYVVARENAPTPPRPSRLSDRERQVVTLATLGRSNKVIAHELGLAHSTVRVLMRRACLKLGTTSRSELISRSLRAAV